MYCVSLRRDRRRGKLEGTAREVVEALRPLTTKPLLVGVGISTPEQAKQAGEFADGVVVGSAIVPHLLEGDLRATVELVVEPPRRARLSDLHSYARRGGVTGNRDGLKHHWAQAREGSSPSPGTRLESPDARTLAGAPGRP